MWENLLGGIGRFASSGLGQTAIGAGLGYGLDRLAGGSGGTGALLGGAGGLLNYGSGTGGNLFGEGTGGFQDTTLGGLFGSQQQRQPQLVQGLGGSLVPAETAIAQGIQPTSAIPQSVQPQGLLDRVQQFGERYSDTGKLLGDIGKTYGNIQSGLAQRDLSQAEIDYRNRIAGLQQADFLDQQRRQREMEANAIAGFGQSGLSSYYSA